MISHISSHRDESMDDSHQLIALRVGKQNVWQFCANFPNLANLQSSCNFANHVLPKSWQSLRHAANFASLPTLQEKSFCKIVQSKSCNFTQEIANKVAKAKNVQPNFACQGFCLPTRSEFN